MDVRCERCKTEYEFDDARITEAGVTVKCTSCAHVFKVKKRSMVVTVPVTGLGEEPELPTTPAAVGPPREWRVRQTNGNLVTFRELTTLQKWIVERKVTRDDEISLTGSSWKRLGSIAELASFFQVVDEAQRGAQLAAAQAAPPPAAPLAPAPLPVRAPAAGQGPTSFGDLRGLGTQEPGFAGIRPGGPASEDETDFDMSVVRRGRLPRVLLVLALLAAGGAAAYYFLVLKAPAPVEPLPVAEVDAGAPELDAGAPVDEAAAAAPAAESAAPPDAGEAPASAAPSVAAAPAPAKDKPDASERPKSFDDYIAQGDRLRDRDKPAAALEAYARALELQPERSEALAGRGLALLDLGRADDALEAFGRALEVNKRYGVAIMGMAETLRSQGKRAEAVEYYQRYLDELPEGPEANVARAAIEKLNEP